MGPVLIGAFVIWFVSRSADIWRRSHREGLEIGRSLARAASLIIALLLAHSFVDYPLRTGAMMAIMAFACALLIAPPLSAPGDEHVGAWIEEDAPKRRRRRHRASSAAHGASSSAPAAPPVTGAAASPSPSRPEPAGWDETVKWPEQWRPSSAGKPASGVDRKPADKPAER